MLPHKPKLHKHKHKPKQKNKHESLKKKKKKQTKKVELPILPVEQWEHLQKVLPEQSEAT
jgi:hypothetical protein